MSSNEIRKTVSGIYPCAYAFFNEFCSGELYLSSDYEIQLMKQNDVIEKLYKLNGTDLKFNDGFISNFVKLAFQDHLEVIKIIMYYGDLYTLIPEAVVTYFNKKNYQPDDIQIYLKVAYFIHIGIEWRNKGYDTLMVGSDYNENTASLLFFEMDNSNKKIKSTINQLDSYFEIYGTKEEALDKYIKNI